MQMSKIFFVSQRCGAKSCGVAAFIWDGVYIGATATKGMLISMALGMVVFFSFYFLLVPVYANHGLWVAFLAYLTTRGVVQTVLRNKVWKTMQ